MRPCADHDRVGCPMTRINRVDGVGLVPCRIMLIGEGPGKVEDKKGKPFVGQSGSELTHLYLSECAGIDRRNVFVTNVVRCRTNEKDRDPTEAEIQACCMILLEEMRDVNPSFIGSLGRIATTFMLGPGMAMEKVHGFGYDKCVRVGGEEIRPFKCMPLYHPAYGLHNTTMMRHIMEDFRRFGKLVRGDASVMWKEADSAT